MRTGRKLSWLVRSADLVSVWMTLRELGDDDGGVPVGWAHSVQPTLLVSRVRHSLWGMCGLRIAQALVDHTYCLCSSGRYLLLIAAGFVSTTAEETNDAYLAKLLPAARLPLGGREGTSRLVASVKLQVPVNI